MKNPRHSLPDSAPSTVYSPNMAMLLAFLSTMLACAMLLSNILAVKIWGWQFFALDGGFFLFPITYVLGDVLAEFFRERIANTVAIWCAGLNLLAYVLFKFTDFLPDAPGTSNVSFSAALSMSGQVIVGSTVAFLVSQCINNRIYDKMHDQARTNTRIWTRTWCSSLIARGFDTAIFTSIAFWERMTIPAMIKQMICSFLAGMLIESLLTPVTVIVIRQIDHRLATPIAASNTTPEP